MDFNSAGLARQVKAAISNKRFKGFTWCVSNISKVLLV